MRYSTLLLLLFAGLVRAQPALLPESAGKLYFEACAPFSEDLVFDCYRSYDEVTQFLEDAADAYPGLVQLSSLGQSYEGRELWVVTITDFLAGDPADKPGIWVDGGIDSDEVVSVEAALGLVHRLLTSDDPEIAELLDTRVFYIAPNVIPDMSERHHRTPMRPYDSTMRPWDDDGDGVADEDGPEDL
ncbi:MAG: M14 family zinc carboxypeptidase, partial [Bacteroidota bacterium]